MNTVLLMMGGAFVVIPLFAPQIVKFLSRDDGSEETGADAINRFYIQQFFAGLSICGGLLLTVTIYGYDPGLGIVALLVYYLQAKFILTKRLGAIDT